MILCNIIYKEIALYDNFCVCSKKNQDLSSICHTTINVPRVSFLKCPPSPFFLYSSWFWQLIYLHFSFTNLSTNEAVFIHSEKDNRNSSPLKFLCKYPVNGGQFWWDTLKVRHDGENTNVIRLAKSFTTTCIVSCKPNQLKIIHAAAEMQSLLWNHHALSIDYTNLSLIGIHQNETIIPTPSSILSLVQYIIRKFPPLCANY